VYEDSFYHISSPTFVFDGVLDDSYSNGGEVESSVVFICISFLARDGEHFSLCFLAIWISSFEKVLLSSVAHFFIESLIFGEFSFWSSQYIMVISPLSDV
jgi:hypothetical protein